MAENLKHTKFIAYFLPGFHEDEFNNKWWGQGFTEWDNVKHCKPLFDKHHQPKIPKIGLYNLSNIDIIKNAFDKAYKNGIYGFSIYDYWYKGKRPLKKVLDTIIQHPEINGNFSICWANHSWTRSWKNRYGALDILIEQTYESKIERTKHFDHLCRVFSDHRYIKHNDKYLFQIYQPSHIPKLDEYIYDLRNYLAKEGMKDIHVSGVVNKWHNNKRFFGSLDSITLGNPTLAMFGPDNIFAEKIQSSQSKLFEIYLRSLPESLKKYIYIIHDLFPEKHTTFQYETLINRLLDQAKIVKNHSGKKIFFSTFSGFDNTARYKKRAKIVLNNNSNLFKKSIIELDRLTDNEDIIFINAWNEWGEGMYLEECNEFEGEFLEALMEIKNEKKF